MLVQIRFFLSDFKKHFLKFTGTLLQFIIVVCLATYILHALWDYKRVENTIEEMTEENQIYMLDNATEDYRFNQLINDTRYFPMMKELNEYAQSRPKVVSYVANASMTISVNHNFNAPRGIEQNSYNGIRQLNCVSITPNFIQVFHLQGDINKNEIAKKFANYKVNDKIIPVILGSAFQRYTKKYEIIQDSRGISYQVLGFLKQGSYYIAPNRGDETIVLDGYFIIPCQVTYNSSLAFSFNFFSTYYITNDKSQITDIMKKSDELGLYGLKLKSFDRQMEYIRADIIEKVLFNSLLCMIILFMSVIGLMGNLIQFITEYMSEFAVHLLCGASESGIILRVGIQVAVLIIGANIMNFAIYGINVSSFITFGLSILLGALIMLYPIIKIYSQSIMVMIRRSTI